MLIILKAIIIGIIASIPIGPIAVLVLQRCMNSGHRAGMNCALGATIVDTIFAIVSVYAFSAISSFIDKHTILIEIIGGVIVVGIGISMVFSKPSHYKDRRVKGKIALDITKSTLMGFSNPGALAVMLALFAAFSINLEGMPTYFNFLVVAGVCGGSLLYWLLFTWLAAKGNGNFKFNTLVRINQVSGIIVVIFGLYLAVAGLVKLWPVTLPA